MGNTANKRSSNADGEGGGDDETRQQIVIGKGCIQTNMLRMLHDDVFKKYKVLEVIGTGSMGFVAKARIRERHVGGSAVYKKKKNRIIKGVATIPEKLVKPFLSSNNNNKKSDKLSERREMPALYALKSIQVDRMSDSFLQELRNEMDILRRLDHPNIVRAYEVFENKRQVYMVLELCDGGDLITRAPFSEKDSALIAGKLLLAIKYMHDHGVVHRDLKFENIMWENDGPDAEIKVIDFGLSKKFGHGERDVMHEGVGNLYTMAPQVLQGVYTSQADLWSVGVIVYMLLSSERPFRGKKRRDVIDKIMRADYSVEGGLWEAISDEAKDLVVRLLQMDPKIRLNATEALAHPWLSKDLSGRKQDEELAKKVKGNLMTYYNCSQLKKIALNVVAHRSTSSEILELRKCFDYYDSSNDGIIEFHEFKAAMKQARYSNEEIESMFGSIDVNNNGHIQYTEFLAATLEAHTHIEEERIAEAFDRLDHDNSGHISKAELISFLGRDATAYDVEELMKEWDTDNDGKISYKEFIQMFRSTTKSVKKQIMDPVEEEEDENVSDWMDAKIPGGKHDVEMNAL